MSRRPIPSPLAFVPGGSGAAPLRLRPVGSGRARLRVERLADGRLEIATPRGLDPLDRLLLEGLAAWEAAGAAPRAALALATDHPFAALVLARRLGGAVHFHYDLFRSRQAAAMAQTYGVDGLQTICAADVPAFDPAHAPELIVATVRRDGETGLTLELLRQARAVLAVGGHLVAATNNPRDRWLARQLERLFGNLSLLRHDRHGRVYAVKRTGRAGADATEGADRYIETVDVRFADFVWTFQTRYGTFSRTGLDEGSRALLESIEPPEPCRAILDLGCGWGAVGLLAARLHGAERLTMIDANARAVEMARVNAARHATDLPATRVDVRLEADAESLSTLGELGAYDLVLTNPPYGADYRVSEHFVQVARLALRLGGRLGVVVKPDPHVERLVERVFGAFETIRRRGYTVLTAVRRN